MKIASVVGARPQFIKLSPLAVGIAEYNRSRRTEKIEHVIIHTGQHYDYEMDRVFFDELGIPEPSYNLGVGSGAHGRQTAEMLMKIEPILLRERPDWTLVYGDTNSTLAGALAAAKLGLPLAHVEAGLRSFNRAMPEEINRVLADRAADLLLCPTSTAVRNLRHEGFDHVLSRGGLLRPSSLRRTARTLPFPLVINVGDIMYDALLFAAAAAEKKSGILEKLALTPHGYILATIHRAENTDRPEILRSITEALAEIQAKVMPLVFALHPRTRAALKKARLYDRLARRVTLIDPPPGYYEILALEKNAAKILTDSGGVQKEAYFLGVPCVTLRNETEWIETTAGRRNIIAGTKRADILNAVRERAPERPKTRAYPYGKGEARRLILEALTRLRPRR
jgi:UDP-N-acetylglucosamine 2-epimerase